MGTEVDGLPEGCGVAEHLRRFEQRLGEIDGALGQLDEKIREAEQKSRYVIRQVAPAFDDA
jgi:hypothetical protein